MNDRSLFAEFRARAVRIGLMASWAVLAVIVVYAVRLEVFSDARVWGGVLGAGLGLATLLVVPWREVLRRPLGDVLLVLWLILTIVLVSLSSSVAGLGEPAFFLFFLVVAFSAAIFPLALHWVTTVLALAGHLSASLLSDLPPEPESLVIEVIALVTVSALTGFVAEEFRRETREGHVKLDELRQREADLERLYELSRTLAAGDSLAEVLPTLVGKITGHLRARVGAVLLYQPEDRSLELLTPIWVHGRTVDVERYRLPLLRGGRLERVFLDRSPLLVHEAADDGLLADLGLHQAMAVPLRVEDRTTGVLVLGDKTEGRFDEGDLETLVSLAAPAGLVVDQLTRRHEAEEAGRRMTELANLKTDFVSVVSHELRTPLTSIIGSLATLTRRGIDPGGQAARELIASARTQAERLRALIEDLLMVSRIDARALPQHPEPIELSSFVPETVEGLPKQEGRVSVEVPEGLAIEADPDYLRRIITNLVDNALKYAPDSPVEVRIEATDDEVVLSVIDHGPGIPAEQHDRVFERFSQLERAQTRERGGTGLGLSIVKSLAEAMGGRVWLEETPGGGATFRVAIPPSPGAIRRAAAR